MVLRDSGVILVWFSQVFIIKIWAIETGGSRVEPKTPLQSHIGKERKNCLPRRTWTKTGWHRKKFNQRNHARSRSSAWSTSSANHTTTVFQSDARDRPPGTLETTGNVAENWKVWKQMWSNYMVVAKLTSQMPEYKVALFLHYVGAEALKIFSGFQFDGPNDKNDLYKIMEKFDHFTIGYYKRGIST